MIFLCGCGGGTFLRGNGEEKDADATETDVPIDIQSEEVIEDVPGEESGE